MVLSGKVLFGILLLWNAVAHARPSTPGRILAGSRPNIVVILTDDQGYGEVGRHGNPILRTPNLDRLHAESTRFTRFHVSPTCAPTRAALLTGRHEFRSGVSHTIFERERLSPKAITLPERLGRLGYSTGIFGKWHLGDEDAYQPDRRGFDEVFIHGGGGIGQGYPGSCGDVPGNTYRDPWIRHNGTFVHTRGYCTDAFVDAATRWIDSRSGKGPFFAWLAPNAPHDPFVSPGPEWEAPYQGQGLSNNAVRYYAMIAHLDAAVGRLLDHLDRTGLSESTLVVFMTDNGHSVPSVYNAGMRGTKGTPYEGGVRVPSFWRWRGHIGPGLDCNRLTAHLDLFPTLLELAGDRTAGGVATDGRSLVPLLADPSSEWADRFLFLHFGRWETGSAHSAKHRRSAVMDSRYKLVEDRELFDLVEDPGEKVNRIAELPREAMRLREAYDRWWNEVLPETAENEWALGPYRNPFKSAFWNQQGGGPDPSLLQLMDPTWKFDPDRPAF